MPASNRSTTRTVCCVLKYKSEVSARTIECLGALLNLLKLTGKPIVRSRADNEFDTNAINEWSSGDTDARRNCIEPQYTARYNSSQNGGSERLEQTIQAKIKVLLSSFGVTSNY